MVNVPVRILRGTVDPLNNGHTGGSPYLGESAIGDSTVFLKFFNVGHGT